MKLAAADIVWTRAGADSPDAGDIRIERHGFDWERTSGDYWMPAKGFDGRDKSAARHLLKQLLHLFLLFHTVVVRDGIDPMKAHAAFLGIDEYREAISPDTESRP